MKTKRTRWATGLDGKPYLGEYWEDQGPSSARGVARNPLGFSPVAQGKARAANQPAPSKPANTRPEVRNTRGKWPRKRRWYGYTADEKDF